MHFGDINLYILVFFILFSNIATNVTTSLHLLLTAELLWVTLYVISLTLGCNLDNLNFLSLTFFFLVLSAAEFGTGLTLILIQNIFLRSTSLNDSSLNNFKHGTKLVFRLKVSQKFVF